MRTESEGEESRQARGLGTVQERGEDLHRGTRGPEKVEEKGEDLCRGMRRPENVEEREGSCHTEPKNVDDLQQF